MPQTVVVIPCYNEASRLNAHLFREYLSAPRNVLLLFVNDGSTDATLSVLQDLAIQSSDRARVLTFPSNRGKAEAVRVGLLAALQETNADYVGFWDADLATPLWTIQEFVRMLSGNTNLSMVFGARVRLLGRMVRRTIVRHYLSRLFAAAASACLHLPIYDTQCGAKLFRRTPELAAALAEPFLSRWIFDVELLSRLIRLRGSALGAEIHEYPLETWTDMAGSRLRPRDFVRAIFELSRICLSHTAGTPNADLCAGHVQW